MKKYYDVPQEITDMFFDSNGLEKLRNVYAKLPFGFRKARRCAIDGQRLFDGAFQKVCELYPELRGKTLAHGAGKVWVVKE